ncbi:MULTISPECIES: hypothetical protein [unclassified Nocardioides]|uniref:hypothetical protein n=1 Tax=unclassified Nocardioides TaxID=2615069 RepID=UPI00070EE83F|nr:MULTISPECIES: hypothetical protein [unclassified Nocardioides]KQY56858.1 hypothetical protein ASD30_11225 [Nocardioides sp. Root140]KRF12979.1 hypothetical protein ASH02_15870 [Nocardioides sp. Soil796]
MSGHVWHDWPSRDEIDPHGSVVTMGVFDGFHRGHQALARRAVGHGARLRLPTLLVTFDPHPMLVTCPERAPRALLDVDDRVDLALAHGVDGVVVLPFTKATAATPAESFVADGLVARLGVRSLVVGSNFKCGRAGAGDVDYLRAAGAWHGFRVDALDLVRVGERTCSSTEVRRLLADGDVDAAAQLLGRRDPRLSAVAV